MDIFIAVIGRKRKKKEKEEKELLNNKNSEIFPKANGDVIHTRLTGIKTKTTLLAKVLDCILPVFAESYINEKPG